METNTVAVESSTSPTESSDGDTLDPLIKMTKLKPDVVKRMLKRSLCGLIPDNPLGTLNALIEPNCFRIDIKNEDRDFKAQIWIGGKTFESVAAQKKKARDLVIVEALNYIFADTLQELRKQDENYVSIEPTVINTTIETQNIVPSPMHIDSILQNLQKSQKRSRDENMIEERTQGNENRSKKQKLDSSDESMIEGSTQGNQNLSKKQKLDSSENCDINPYGVLVKKEVKEAVLKRVVRQALGLTNTENPNTVTALYTLFEKDSFSLESTGLPNPDGNFVCNLTIQGRKYTDVGASIKKSKTNVTKKALRDLFPSIIPGCEITENLVKKNGDCIKSEIDFTLPSLFVDGLFGIADLVAPAILSKYNEIVAPFEEHFRKYTVLSGIVMVENDDVSAMTIICISTGKIFFLM